MKASELVEKAIMAYKLPTQYVQGGYGCRLGKDWYDKNYSWNKANSSIIESKYNTVPITFGFDCVCLVKALLFWGFEGVSNEANGGSVYNRETDYTVSKMYDSCTNISTDFDKIEAGEFLFIGKSHIGIYIGNGEVIECTPAWKCCVQRTLLPSRNTTNYEKLPVRSWDCHGKSKFVDFGQKDSAYETLSKKCKELEAENFRLIGKLNKIKEIVNNEN